MNTLTTDGATNNLGRGIALEANAARNGWIVIVGRLGRWGRGSKWGSGVGMAEQVLARTTGDHTIRLGFGGCGGLAIRSTLGGGGATCGMTGTLLW